MAFSSINPKVAVKDRTTFHNGGTIVDSMNFGNIRPFLVREYVPHDSFKIGGATICQFLPMVSTTMADIYLKHQAFAIPYRIVWDDWDNFINGKKAAHFNINAQETISTLDSVPWFTSRALACIFFSSSYGYAADGSRFTKAGSPSNYDFALNLRRGAWTPSSMESMKDVSQFNYYSLTPRGKKFYFLLKALGYRLDLSSICRVDPEVDSKPFYLDDYKMPALPLMAWAKCYTDYLRMTKGVDDDMNTGFIHLINLDCNQALLNYYPQLYKLTLNYYSDDYFTSAMQTPSFTELGADERMPMTKHTSDMLDNDNVILEDIHGVRTDKNIGQLTASALRNIKAVFNWAVRNNLAGQKVQNLVKARFGVEAKGDKMKRVLNLGNYTSDISVFRVDVTASTTDAKAGEFAGKGMGSGNFEFTFNENDGDYGLLICCYSVNVVPRYAFGITPQMLHLNRDDFFTPEFDGIGTRPIYHKELLAGAADYLQDITQSQALQHSYPLREMYTNTFGFTPMYSEYKGSFGIDLNNGDFTLRKYLSSTSPFFTDKLGTFSRSLSADPSLRVQNNESFLSMEDDSRGYLKIFQDTSEDVDHIYLFTKVRVDSTRPMCNVFDVPDLEGGRNIAMMNNGTHD